MELIKEPGDDVALGGNGNDAAENGVKVYSDVTNMQQARTLLMNPPYNCSLAQLQNKNAVKAVAQDMAVSFPNWL